MVNKKSQKKLVCLFKLEEYYEKTRRISRKVRFKPWSLKCLIRISNTETQCTNTEFLSLW